jgi:hypothetical protein
MHTNAARYLLTFALILRLVAIPPGIAVAQTFTSEEVPPGGDPWPRQVPTTGATIKIYQPQLDTWTGNTLSAYSAVAVKSLTSSDTTYGVIWFTARTEVDKVNRLVTLSDLKVTKLKFPSLPGNGAQYMQALQGDLPWSQTIPLDLLETSVATTQAAAQQKQFPLQNNPPNVIVSSTPAVLALIDGQPALRPAADNLQKVINTRALIVFDPGNQMYYLALMDGWVEAPSIQGPWSLAKHDPKRSLDKLRQGSEQSDQNQVLGNPEQSLKDAYQDGEAPTVYVSTTPAELILLQGQPQYTPIPGTNLMYVENSGNDVFMDSANQMFYILISGRWFSSSALQSGSWTFVAASTLPSGFANIPSYSPKASVLVSVPGTPQAKEALIANQIPQTATISRTSAQLQVNYYGAPAFTPIAGTNLSYATNTRVPVIMIPASPYYAVQNAVWFSSPTPQGPWAVATSVPASIYSIPPSSPIHYVTYAYVYGSTPASVYVGYTPGYYGTVVSSDGVVVYGTGYTYPSYVGAAAWVPAPYTYGVGAAFSWSALGGWGLGFGLGMAAGSACGPWWGPVGGWGWGYATPAWGWGGYGGAAAANVYGRWGNTAYAGTRAAWANPYTGNIGAAARGGFHNPVTGASGIGARGADFNAYTGNYAAGRRDATYNPSTGIVHGGATGTVGNAYTGQSISGSRGFSYNTNTGNGIGHAGNDVYADHDGNVYKYNQGAGWQQRSGDSWQSASRDMTSSLGNMQSSRGWGDQRWGGFHSGGWGGGFGGGGWADRGRWGGGGFGGFDRGFGGFRGGGFRR